MDTERGNLEILFQEIPYYHIAAAWGNHNYRAVNERLYLKYAKEVFPYNSEDEIRNKYIYLKDKIREKTVFTTITDFAKKVLVYDGNEIKCKIDEMLRWREISFQLGQDLFTCAFLADADMQKGTRTEYFAWIPIIRSDDLRLQNILNKGIADNHFHLNGSTKIFELNWLCLMNIIENRRHDFKKLPDTLQRHIDDTAAWNPKETLYGMCQRAALYRVYLFAVLRRDKYLILRTEELLKWMKEETNFSVHVSEIQDVIMLTKHIYGAVVDDKHILDYALEKTMFGKNNNNCRLLSGERKFLYDCFKAVMEEKFNDGQCDIFYQYLSMRTQFRGELIQVNRQVGFANFSNYETRKEIFIEKIRMYEEELVRLAVNEPLSKDYMKSLEARICPGETPSITYHKIARNERIIADKDCHNKLIYVLHFPKSMDVDFQYGKPRHYKLRGTVRTKSEGIAKLLMSKTPVKNYIRGIDACANEVNCRPEVFAQSFRFLSDIMFETESPQDRYKQKIMTKLHVTYHVGEDFLDIVDGIRAVDEALLFCGLGRGSRIGHGLALGIDPYSYYCYKGKTLVMEKQRLLDDIVWILCKADELGIDVDRSLRTELESKFYALCKEIYDNILDHEITMQEYYCSWKLRGDRPELYWLCADGIKEKVERTDNAVIKYDRYGFNRQLENIDGIRKIKDIRVLYHAYHFDEGVRKKGSEMIVQKVDGRYVDVVKQLQDGMIQRLVMSGIGIETNPSSNYLIGTIMKYDEHPILRFNARKLTNTETNMSLNVSINTDDQGVFDTLLENEYALMELALKKAKDEKGQYKYDIEDIYEWLDYVRNMGLQQVFRNN